MMHLFKQHKVGAGLVLAREEERRRKALKRWKKGAKIDGALALHHGTVMSSWVDYNGHMRMPIISSLSATALDAFFRYIGDDEAYRATGHTFFTAETHLNYYREMKAGEPFTIETQLVGCDEKRMHLFHRMLHGKTGELVATNEIMQLHVDQKAGKVVPDARRHVRGPFRRLGRAQEAQKHRPNSAG